MILSHEVSYHSLKRKSHFIVFYKDFATELGLSYLLKNSRFTCTPSLDNDHATVDGCNYSEKNISPVYESINYFLRLNKRCVHSKIIILTESHDPLILKLLDSFRIFYLLSKKEDSKFIHHVVTQTDKVMNQDASPDIINKIGKIEIIKPM